MAESVVGHVGESVLPVILKQVVSQGSITLLYPWSTSKVSA